MAIVIIDETNEEGRELLKFLQDKDYVEILDDDFQDTLYTSNGISEPPHSYGRERVHDWWDTISEEERKHIEAGLDDMANGRTVPHEEVRKLYEKWL